MSITTTWFNPEQTVLLTTFEHDYTLIDYGQALKQQRATIAQMNHVVHLVSIFHTMPTLPRAGISTVSKMVGTIPTNEGLHILVGQSMFFKMLRSVMQRMYPDAHRCFLPDVQFATSVGDALTLIKQYEHEQTAINR
ncbi:MAG: hypothetical protein SF123_21840 [Chloroflexota bacterium]|nr:hypothetical protein [Chloroflexota bacterium]